MIKNCKNISWGVLYLQRIPIATTNSWGRHSFLHGKKELFTKKVFDFEFLENHTQAHVPLTTRLESSMLPESNNGREGTRLCGIGMFLSSSSSSSLSLSAPLRGRGLCGVAAKQRHDAIQFHLCMTCPNEAKKSHRWALLLGKCLWRSSITNSGLNLNAKLQCHTHPFDARVSFSLLLSLTAGQWMKCRVLW